MMHQIRMPRPEDMASIKILIERSVRELCYIDHGNDEVTIQLWLAAAYGGLFTDHVIVAACEDGSILGVASMNKDGLVFLNYVDPIAIKQKISATLLAHLQLIALNNGLTYIQLISTATARHFYLKHGFEETRAPTRGNGVSWNHHMVKWIRKADRLAA